MTVKLEVFNSSFPQVIISPLDIPSLANAIRVVLKSEENALITFMLFKITEHCDSVVVVIKIIEVGVYCSTITPFFFQSIAGKSTAMQVNFIMLPGQREGGGLTPICMLEISDKDLSLWAPAWWHN